MSDDASFIILVLSTVIHGNTEGGEVKATVTADRLTIPAGGSVTLTCEVKYSADFKYEWFREPHLNSDQKTTVAGHGVKITVTTDSTTIPAGGSVTLTCDVKYSADLKYEWFRETASETKSTTPDKSDRRVRISKGGNYTCKGWRKDINSLIAQSDPVIIQEIASKPRATLVAQSSIIPAGGSVTLSCSVEGSTGWKFDWFRLPSKPTVTLQPSWTQIYSDKPKAKLRADNTAVPVGGSVTLTCSVNPSSSSGWKYYWYRDEKSSEALTTQDAVFHSNGQISVSQEGLYRCRGGRGNPVYYTEDSQSVRIGKTGWSFYWYKAVPDLSEKSSSYELLPDGSGTAQDSYIIHGQTHTAGYVCRAGRGDPEYHTDHSQPTFVWSADVHSAASLTVSPDRVQHFTSDSVSLTCEGNFTEWRVRKFSEDGRLYSDCPAEDVYANVASVIQLRVINKTNGLKMQTRRFKVPNKPTVTLQPSWTQIYSGETVTVRCEIQGGEGAQWTYEWRAAKLNTPPTSNEYRIIRATESDSGGYSCRGRRDYFFTEWSDIITLTVSFPSKPTVTLQPSWTQIYSDETVTVRCEIQGDKPRPVLTVSPSWLSPGASVTLNCEVEHPSAGWSFYWYKAVPDLSEKSSSYELLPDGSGTAQDSYIIHGQTHTAGYVCRAGRGDPEYHTDHSQSEFVWSADVHSAASLTVSPDRVQHFTSDSVSLTCEGNFTEWRVRKFSEDGRLYSDCRRMTGSTCNINTSKSDTAVYWCESGSGEFSSAVNITVQNDGNDPILVSPVHPVTEGASVSLSCNLRTQKILSNVFFYHNDKLIQNDTRGELKISAVSKSDEGFYKCQYSGRESAQSWMSVKVIVSGADSSSSPVWLIVGLVCGVSLIIILLLLLYRCRRTNSAANEQTLNQDEDQQHVYSSLLHGDRCVYETVRRCENTENGPAEGDYTNVTSVIQLKVINKTRQRGDPEESSDYNDVNPNSATALKS
ncbi:adhesion G-protein coupled receptor G5 [Sarotherodon galilaeus]